MYHAERNLFTQFVGNIKFMQFDRHNLFTKGIEKFLKYAYIPTTYNAHKIALITREKKRLTYKYLLKVSQE